MDLRPRLRPSFSGFTTAEVEKMGRLLKDDEEQSFDSEFCKKLARAFNHSKGRAGKPVVKWTEVQNWFQSKQPIDVPEEGEDETAQILPTVAEACSFVENSDNRSRAKGKKVLKLPKLEFEAKSSKDGAWYDIDRFLGHRHLDSGDAEVLVRFDRCKKDREEWVNVLNAVRQQSITLEDFECQIVKVGETALCFQEQNDTARYFEVEIVDIQRKVHDVRGCRCLFTIRYIHDDNTGFSTDISKVARWNSAMNLRHKKRPSFSGFTTGEVEKMERLLKEDGEQSFDTEYCKKLASAFNTSKGCTGKAVVKWTEVQNWFQTQPPIVVSEKGADGAESETAQLFRAVREACSLNGKRGDCKKTKGKKVPELPKMMEFEAKSSKDGAWYDVDKFVGNRSLDSPHACILVRFSGFQQDQDEWVKVKNAVRQRSISLKASECHKVEVGEMALYYLDKGKNEAKYFEAEISDIQRRMHDMRSCKCDFTIRYIYDDNKKKIPLQEKVELKCLYFRPSILFS